MTENIERLMPLKEKQWYSSLRNERQGTQRRATGGTPHFDQEKAEARRAVRSWPLLGFGGLWWRGEGKAGQDKSLRIGWFE